MYSQAIKKACFLLVLVRVALPLLFKNLSSTLAERPELSVPTTSYKILLEAIYLFNHKIDPYTNGPFNQPPLLLAIYHFIPVRLHFLIPVLFDVLISYFLYHIALFRKPLLHSQDWLEPELIEFKNEDKYSTGITNKDDSANNKEGLRKRIVAQKQTNTTKNAQHNKEEDSTIPPKDEIDPELVSLLYLFNPMNILSCLCITTGGWGLVCLAGGLHYSCLGKRKQSMLLISLATYFTLYPIVALVPCIILINNQKQEEGNVKSSSKCVILFLLYQLILMLASFLMMDNSWEFLKSAYGAILIAPDLAPNIGLYWYFFTEMFEQFRYLFLFVFQLLALVIFVGPVSIRFRQQPLFAAYVLITMSTILKTYPTIGDIGLCFGLVALFPELLRYAPGMYVMTILIVFASFFLPLFHHLWLYSGAGNANFYYAITLVFNAGQVGWVIGMVRAMLSREGERFGGNGLWRKLRLVTSIY